MTGDKGQGRTDRDNKEGQQTATTDNGQGIRHRGQWTLELGLRAGNVEHWIYVIENLTGD